MMTEALVLRLDYVAGNESGRIFHLLEMAAIFSGPAISLLHIVLSNTSHE